MLDRLPLDMVVEIMGFLSASDVGNAALVCRNAAAAARDDLLHKVATATISIAKLLPGKPDAELAGSKGAPLLATRLAFPFDTTGLLWLPTQQIYFTPPLSIRICAGPS